MIETLVIDLGGVAAQFVPGRRLKALAELSGLPESLIQARLFDSEFEDRAELGTYSLDEVLTMIQKALERQLPVEALVNAWSLAFKPDDKVLEAIASSGVPKALFTNNGPIINACLAGPLVRLGSVFNEVVTSAEIKARKPDLAAFQRAALRLGSLPAA